MTEHSQNATVASPGGAQKEAPGRRVPLLRAVEPSQGTPESDPKVQPFGTPAGSVQSLGRVGLRLAFWLCGFTELVQERQLRGEALTDRERSLLTLAGKDFAAIRPVVIGLALHHLRGVLDEAGPAAGEMEAFALKTLQSLSAHAADLFRSSAPEAVLSLFGGPEVEEPLAIFQLVFSSTIAVAESFARLIPGEAPALARTIEALGSEVERI